MTIQNPSKSDYSIAEQRLSRYYPIFLSAIVIGILAIFMFSFQASSIDQFFSVFTTGLLIATACLAIGALVGFLFGIPYVNQADSSKDQEDTITNQNQKSNTPSNRPYKSNTNLEQISDWLTKILVGVGLVQLTQVPTALQTFSNSVAPALGGWSSSGIFSIAILLYFLIIGFLLLFLWTKIVLPLIFSQSDVEQTQISNNFVPADQAEREKQVIATLAQTQIGTTMKDTTAETAEDEALRLAEMSFEVEGAVNPKRVLWMDDQPQNNQNEMSILRRKFQVQIDGSLTVNDALDKLDNVKYDLVISDLGHPEDSKAGLHLLGKMRAKQDYTNFILYTRYQTQKVVDETAKLRAIATNSPIVLIEKASGFLES